MSNLNTEYFVFPMRRINLALKGLFLLGIIFSVLTFYSTGFAQYAGTIEWKSPDFGEADDINVSDVDGDGNLEIITIGGGSVHVFGHDGTTYQEEWASQVLTNDLDTLVVGDMDSDGTLEIIVSTMEAGNIYIYVFGFDGSNYQLEWQSDLFPGDGYNGLSLYAVDADGDGTLEIVATRVIYGYTNTMELLTNKYGQAAS